MCDHYSIEKIAYWKIAEEREAAACYWLSVRADKARREVQRTAKSPLTELLGTLACVFRFGSPVPEQHAQ